MKKTTILNKLIASGIASTQFYSCGNTINASNMYSDETKNTKTEQSTKINCSLNAKLYNNQSEYYPLASLSSGSHNKIFSLKKTKNHLTEWLPLLSKERREKIRNEIDNVIKLGFNKVGFESLIKCKNCFIDKIGLEDDELSQFNTFFEQYSRFIPITNNDYIIDKMEYLSLVLIVFNRYLLNSRDQHNKLVSFFYSLDNKLKEIITQIKIDIKVYAIFKIGDINNHNLTIENNKPQIALKIINAPNLDSFWNFLLLNDNVNICILDIVYPDYDNNICEVLENIKKYNLISVELLTLVYLIKIENSLIDQIIKIVSKFHPTYKTDNKIQDDYFLDPDWFKCIVIHNEGNRNSLRICEGFRRFDENTFVLTI